MPTHNFKLVSKVLYAGYKFTLLTLSKNCGFAVPIFSLLIFSKKMADTTYCGPLFILFFKISRYIFDQNDVAKCSLDYITI